MDFLVIALIALGFGVPLAISIRRSTELFVLRVQTGRPHFRRGRIPRPLFDEFKDVLGESGETGRIVVRTSYGEPVLLADASFTPETQQQLRNVLGRYPVARIRTGKPPARSR